MSKRKIRVTEEGANALRPLLEHPKYELIPLKNATEQAAFLPVGATVTVTASPSSTVSTPTGSMTYPSAWVMLVMSPLCLYTL